MQGNGSTQPLILRYRPATFDEVVGNSEAVSALQRRISDEGRPHSYLLTGPSGTGKTTLARIVAAALGSTIMEIDAASNSGVDAMRALVDVGAYRAFNASTRMIILDECHRLSRSAWDAALKLIEEPPQHLYLSLCTTEFHRVPETIVTRCNHVKLNRLEDSLIEEFLIGIIVRHDDEAVAAAKKAAEEAGREDIGEVETWADKLNPDVFRLIVQEANGSPRMALSLLQSCYDAPSREEAQRIMTITGSSDPMRQVLSILVGGQGKWGAIRPLLAQMDAEDFSEGALIGAARYVIGSLNREEDERKARRLYELLAAMTYPAHSFDPRATFYAAVGRFLWEGV